MPATEDLGSKAKSFLPFPAPRSSPLSLCFSPSCSALVRFHATPRNRVDVWSCGVCGAQLRWSAGDPSSGATEDEGSRPLKRIRVFFLEFYVCRYKVCLGDIALFV